MMRCIAILTLAMATYANEAKAQGPVETTTANVSMYDHLRPGLDLFYVSMYDHFYIWLMDNGDLGVTTSGSEAGIRISGDDDDVQWLTQSQINALIAIIAFQFGPQAATTMLVDMGFSPAVADDMILKAIAIYGVRRY